MLLLALIDRPRKLEHKHLETYPKPHVKDQSPDSNASHETPERGHIPKHPARRPPEYTGLGPRPFLEQVVMGCTEKRMRRQLPERGRGKNTERGLEPKATEELGLALRVLQEPALTNGMVWVRVRRRGI